jgi:phosphoenolpyruvate-protein phosphotransferase (PTS system enzyme I)
MAGGGRQSLTGSGVARGIAIGRAHLLAHSELEVRQYTIERRDVVIEIGRLTTAFNSVRQELDHLKGTISADAPSEVRAFLDLHTMILDDALLAESPRDLIRTRLINAEWALTIQLEEVCRQFEAIDDEYLRERSADVRQVVERVLGALAEGRPARVSLPRKLAAGERLVLVAQDMAPADVLHLKDRADIDLAGFVTERGGPTSHTAILARSLGLPAVVGVGGARAAIGEGDLVIIDGDADAVVVNPTEEEVASVHQRLREQIEHRSQLRKLRGRLSRTQDGVAVELLANIELPQDARDALEAGADGIGLFRSEFLFMDRGELPSEDEQYEAYAKVARAMKGKQVVIRTLDIGADKVLTAAAREGLGMGRGAPRLESNPALGLRAIRYCLAYPELFLTQLRAILRASEVGTVRILVPMLSQAQEIEQALAFVARAKEQLKDRKQKYDARILVGGMIEVPAAALSVSQFVERLKFLSIGTNDLIQYTLAIDRADSSVAHLYDHLHPAVLHLIAQTIKGGIKAGIPVSVCGEMAGDLALTELLLGMGLRQFSMHPAQILHVKERLFDLGTKEAERLAGRVLRESDPVRIRAALEHRAVAVPASGVRVPG